MKTIHSFMTLFIIGALLTLTACGPVPEFAEATVAITPNVKTDACITNYSRRTPNFCSFNAGSSTGLILDNTCRQLDFNAQFGAPSSTSLVRINVVTTLSTGNALALRRVLTQFYTTNACSTLASPNFDISAREQVAAAATTLLTAWQYGELPLINGSIWYKAQSVDGSANHTTFVQMQGYYD